MKRLILCLFVVAAVSVPAGSVFAEPGGKNLPVKAKAVDRPAKWIEITADEFIAQNSGKQITYKGNVLAKGDFTLCADELILKYNDAKVLSEVLASGSVGIVDGGRAATGENAFYDKARAAIIISGNASAMQCGTEVNGDKITFYLDKDGVNVEGSAGRVKAVVMPGSKKCESSAKYSENTVCAKPR